MGRAEREGTSVNDWDTTSSTVSDFHFSHMQLHSGMSEEMGQVQEMQHLWIPAAIELNRRRWLKAGCTCTVCSRRHILLFTETWWTRRCQFTKALARQPQTSHGSKYVISGVW